MLAEEGCPAGEEELLLCFRCEESQRGRNDDGRYPRAHIDKPEEGGTQPRQPNREAAGSQPAASGPAPGQCFLVPRPEECRSGASGPAPGQWFMVRPAETADG
jgi:hypothetical protein